MDRDMPGPKALVILFSLLLALGGAATLHDGALPSATPVPGAEGKISSYVPGAGDGCFILDTKDSEEPQPARKEGGGKGGGQGGCPSPAPQPPLCAALGDLAGAACPPRCLPPLHKFRQLTVLAQSLF